MDVSDELDAIVEQIAAGTWTKLDLIALRRTLISDKRTV